ncbi:MAG: hypothetical protein NZT61_02885 [Deltaproteobacteria bacterium]|nr:hypothetical protein [Deltaproteobacteria bacterium]
MINKFFIIFPLCLFWASCSKKEDNIASKFLTLENADYVVFFNGNLIKKDSPLPEASFLLSLDTKNEMALVSFERPLSENEINVATSKFNGVEISTIDNKAVLLSLAHDRPLEKARKDVVSAEKKIKRVSAANLVAFYGANLHQSSREFEKYFTCDRGKVVEKPLEIQVHINGQDLSKLNTKRNGIEIAFEVVKSLQLETFDLYTSISELENGNYSLDLVIPASLADLGKFYLAFVRGKIFREGIMEVIEVEGHRFYGSRTGDFYLISTDSSRLPIKTFQKSSAPEVSVRANFKKLESAIDYLSSNYGFLNGKDLKSTISQNNMTKVNSFSLKIPFEIFNNKLVPNWKKVVCEIDV